MKRIAVFIRKHNRLVSIIGALIVFVTFLIKEGLREKLKEFVDETWRAEEAYRAEENTRSILNAIAQMQINSDIPKDSGVSRWFERDDEEEEELLIGNLTLLIERLPERRRLEKRYKELADEQRALMALKYDEPAPNTRGKGADVPGSAAFRERYQKLVSDSRRFLKEVLSEARQQRVARENYLEVADWASYGFYTLGWFLGFISHIVGAKPFQLEES